MPSKVILIVIEFMFLGINIFLGPSQTHFSPRLAARAKMSLSRAQNIFMPANINSIVILIKLHSRVIEEQSESLVYQARMVLWE